MHPEPAAPDPNDLFREYVAAAEPADGFDPLLNALVVDVAQPLVRRVIGRRLSSVRAIHAQDIDDVCSEAMTALMGRLRAFRENPDAAAIADFESWVAGLAGHTAFQFLARRFPERSRLRSRIRYVLSTDPRVTIRQAGHGFSWCAVAGGESGPRASPADIERVRCSVSAARLPDVIHAILLQIDGTIELGDLTSVVASVLGVEESGASASLEFPERIADPGGPSAAVGARDWLPRLWKEVVILPVAQRIALLLNLRPEAGSGMWLLTDLRLASFRELAGMLGMVAEALAESWNRLPLEDREIAERWGWQRQQVINLRSAARQRLARRMKTSSKSSPAAISWEILQPPKWRHAWNLVTLPRPNLEVTSNESCQCRPSSHCTIMWTSVRTAPAVWRVSGEVRTKQPFMRAKKIWFYLWTDA